MKLHKYTPILIMRLTISKKGEPNENVNISDATFKETCNYIKKLILKQNISPFEKGLKTSVKVRECLGDQKLKSENISFRGLTPKQVADLITNDLTKQESK